MDHAATRRRMKAITRPAGCALVLSLARVSISAFADVSRDQAAAAAQRQTGGRVLSVDKSESSRRPVWRVKVVTPQGEVRVLLIDITGGHAE